MQATTPKSRLPFESSAVFLRTLTTNNTQSEFYLSNQLVQAYIIYFVVIELIIILPTIIGSSLIIVSIVTFRHLRSHMHILVANLALADLLVGSVLIPMDLVLMNGDLSNKNICLVNMSLSIAFLLASVLNLLLISLERYMAIVHPLTYKVTCTDKRLM